MNHTIMGRIETTTGTASNNTVVPTPQTKDPKQHTSNRVTLTELPCQPHERTHDGWMCFSSQNRLMTLTKRTSKAGVDNRFGVSKTDTIGTMCGRRRVNTLDHSSSGPCVGLNQPHNQSQMGVVLRPMEWNRLVVLLLATFLSNANKRMAYSWSWIHIPPLEKIGRQRERENERERLNSTAISVAHMIIRYFCYSKGHTTNLETRLCPYSIHPETWPPFCPSFGLHIGSIIQKSSIGARLTTHQQTHTETHSSKTRHTRHGHVCKRALVPWNNDEMVYRNGIVFSAHPHCGRCFKLASPGNRGRRVEEVCCTSQRLVVRCTMAASML